MTSSRFENRKALDSLQMTPVSRPIQIPAVNGAQGARSSPPRSPLSSSLEALTALSPVVATLYGIPEALAVQEFGFRQGQLATGTLAIGFH